MHMRDIPSRLSRDSRNDSEIWPGLVLMFNPGRQNRVFSIECHAILGYHLVTPKITSSNIPISTAVGHAFRHVLCRATARSKPLNVGEAPSPCS